jgi:hypothetical protein
MPSASRSVSFRHRFGTCAPRDAGAGTIERADGSTEGVTPELIMGPAERALRILSVAVVALACASVMKRVW